MNHANHQGIAQAQKPSVHGRDIPWGSSGADLPIRGAREAARPLRCLRFFGGDSHMRQVRKALLSGLP